MSLEGRRSIQLSYGLILGCALILLELEHQFDKLLLTANESVFWFAFFRLSQPRRSDRILFNTLRLFTGFE
jgi:hypothetical protein